MRSLIRRHDLRGAAGATALDGLSASREATMNDLTIDGVDATKTISEDTRAALSGKMRGSTALPGQDGYEPARTIWNGMIDRRPALVARCRGPADVIHALVRLRHCRKMSPSGV